MFISDSTFRWIMFFINPFVAMIFTFKEFLMPYAKNMFWAFCTFYGLTYAIGIESQGSDITRYVDELKLLYVQESLTIGQLIQYFINSGEIDILRTLLSYTISRFTDSQGVLTMVYGFIFGYFFSRNIWYVFSLLKNRLTLISKIVLFTLILVMPIWQIGGFRMWTAFHVFMYGLLPFIFENKKDKLIFLYLSFLVHFSYLIPISIFLGYRLFGNRIKLYFIIFIISFLISEINVGVVNTFIDSTLPEILVERTSGYRNEAVIEDFIERQEQSTRNWYIEYKDPLLKWSLVIVLIYIFIYGIKKTIVLQYWRRLFSITLLMYTTANFLAYFPSGSRFMYIAFFLTLVMIIIYLDQFYKDVNFRQLLTFLVPIFLLFIIVSLRKALYNTSITSVFGNPLLALLSIGNNISLNDLLK